MEQYYPRIDELFREDPSTTRGVLFVTQHGCLPVPYVTGISRAECDGLSERALSLAENPDIDTVVIAAAWSTYPIFSDPQNSEKAFRALESVIEDYRNIGRRVYLILPIPKGADFDPSHLLERGISDFGFRIARTQVEQTKVVGELLPISSRLREVAKSTGATAVDPVDFICREGVCPTLMTDGSPIYRDASHLGSTFVRQYATFMDAIVSTAGNP